jgi:signal transduction histidine kinase
LDRVTAHLASQSSEVAEAQDRLSAARSQLAEARADLLRIARGLYPGAIADGSLESALHSIAASSPIPVELDLRVPRVEPDTAAVVYFVCSEAVANAARHSEATRVAILVERRLSGAAGDDVEVVVEVSDDGIGGADTARGSGLRGLADRVSIAGGVLTVSSGSSGTRLVARLPDGGGAVTAGR